MKKIKVEKKVFLGMNVRVVNGEYLVLKDMFSALGRVREDGSWTDEKKKVVDFSSLGVITAPETFVVTSKGNKQSRQTQDVQCVLLSDVPLILTQFKPTARVGEEALQTWVKFMKFVNDILTTLEVHKYIITDKENQKDHIRRVAYAGGNPTITNQQVNSIMGELIGVDGRVKKEELKSFQNQTTVDLLEVRNYVLEKFVNAYEFTKSHKTAREMACSLAKIKYLEDGAQYLIAS